MCNFDPPPSPRLGGGCEVALSKGLREGNIPQNKVLRYIHKIPHIRRECGVFLFLIIYRQFHVELIRPNLVPKFAYADCANRLHKRQYATDYARPRKRRQQETTTRDGNRTRQDDRYPTPTRPAKPATPRPSRPMLRDRPHGTPPPFSKEGLGEECQNPNSPISLGKLESTAPDEHDTLLA